MFNVISQRTFAELQLGAGVLLTDFDPTSPATPDDDDIITATTGGINISVVPALKDLGEDIDNCPKNTADLQHIDDWDVQITTTALGVSPDMIALALGAADISSGAITPRKQIVITDFKDELWWVGEVGTGGYAAVKLSNAFSTGGFVLQTEDNGKGKVNLTIKAFKTLATADTVPCTFYADLGIGITLNKSGTTLAVNATETLVATTVPEGQTVTWTSSNATKATVANGVVTGKAAGTAKITASMTFGGKSYSAECNITVE